MAPSDAVDELAMWLLSPESRGLPVEQTLGQSCDRLVEAGFAPWRVRLLLLTQHPEVLGFAFEWARGGGHRMVSLSHDLPGSDGYAGSAIDGAQRSGKQVRVRLERAEDRARLASHADLDELAAQGGTDFIAQPLLLGDGRISCLTVATDKPGGFEESDLRALERLVPFLAVRLELRSTQFALHSLLATYLGPNAAKRVLRGDFRRGTGETMRAAIWYCDMRGFTDLSDVLPPREVVDLLDRFFEAIAASVESQGGEILKFVGDAALAVFPLGDEAPGPSCARALTAAVEARARVALLSVERVAAGHAKVTMGVALHLGDVMYGNIGGRRRLDFTVIGAAVNEAARLESLCKTLGATLLMSAPFANAVGIARARSLGVHTFRGVRVPQEIFTLADTAT